jgi:hypothetical protein
MAHDFVSVVMAPISIPSFVVRTLPQLSILLGSTSTLGRLMRS